MATTAVTTTILTETVTTTNATWDEGHPVVDPDQLEDLVGWSLKPEGLCRNEACVPVPDRSSLNHPDGIDLSAVASALGRPVLVDADAQLVAIGAATAHRQQAMVDRRAPDATVFDLEGTRRQLSEWSGTRRLLVAFSTW
jgi:hypothetical protein|tara:strand:+ start:438 stop:857 length:420 start_codon:yes stop_codon:yes gene_type:complete